MTAHLEYRGFRANGATREYTLRVRLGVGEPTEFTVAIPLAAFLDQRVRYQDGPEVCFLKLQRALVEAGEEMPARHLDVTDAEMAEYRVAHAPRAPQRRPKPVLEKPAVEGI